MSFGFVSDSSLATSLAKDIYKQDDVSLSLTDEIDRDNFIDKSLTFNIGKGGEIIPTQVFDINGLFLAKKNGREVIQNGKKY